MLEKYYLESLKRINHLEELDVDEKNIKMELSYISSKAVDWIRLAQDEKYWWALYTR
jgi:hypothetical protein